MPSNDLRVAVPHFEIEDGNIGVNLNNALSLISELSSENDIVVLPELFSTNLITDEVQLKVLAEDETNSPTLEALSKAASDQNCALSGSLLIKSGDNYFNRAFLLLPDGSRHFYDKHHLFILGHESRLLKAGSQKPIIAEFYSWKLRLAVCYDIRFPVWLRNSGLEWDCLIVPSSWPNSRSYAWHHLLIARAIENQGYVVGANRCGTDLYGNYPPEQVAIYDCWGKPVGQSGPKSHTALLSATELEKCRSRFPVWRDADRFSLSE